MEAKSKILVIDDERGPRESLRFLLMDTYDVTCVDSVDEGVRKLTELVPDLIIMDIRMPGKTGIQGLEEIRQRDASVSVIMLTGFGALETAQEALRLGANDYIKKPFDTQQMRETVQRNVQRTVAERRKAHAAKELNAMNVRLAEELAEKEHLANVGQASAEFAHDLRNPLTVVTGYLHLLDDQLGSVRQAMGERYEEVIDSVGVIEKNLQRCQDLAETWQTYCKKGEAVRERMQLHPMISELVEGVRPLADSCGAQIDYRAVREDVEAEVEAPQILRALHNLVTNALHAVMEQGRGRIGICLDERDGLACVEVSDDGVGMSEEQVQKAFDAYFTTKPAGQGTGLGLHITRKVMTDHNGTVEIASEQGRGTRVTLCLPVSAVVS